MFSWLSSPQLPDTIETQAFRSISGGPTVRINVINDRIHRMKVVPWEDILEVFPNAIYLRDANGIVMPARDTTMKRISPRSIKLQADVVLEVVSSQDPPPATARPENITMTEGLASETSSVRHSADEHQSKSASARNTISTTTSSMANGLAQEDESDWSPFQANSVSIPALPSSSSSDQKNYDLLRQEMIHRMELLTAEQEERLSVILSACRKPQ
ncbi:hypothetical protein BGX26_011187 [Mortierella sp. AD094]|nr:hypothetical protein BGX26_011187 [Mortierella sp. AD094]